jgi:outer membrane protein assembly factor BamB
MVAVAVLALVLSSCTWQDFRFLPDGTGFNPFETTINASNVAGLRPRWSETSPVPAVESSPVVSNGMVYVSASTGRLDAFDAANGTARWSYSTGSSNAFDLVGGTGGLRVPAPAIYGGLVYVMGGDGTLYAINASSGTKVWSATTTASSPLPSSLVVANGFVYVAEASERMFVFNATTGASIWSDSLGSGDRLNRTPAVANGVVYIPMAGQLYARDANTGGSLWSVLTNDDNASSPAVANGVVYISASGRLLALDATNGRTLWTAAGGGGAPAVAKGVVYVSTDFGALSAFDATSGVPLWSTADRAVVAHVAPIVAGGVVYIEGADGRLDAYDASSGSLLWSSEDTATDVEPVVVDGVVYTAANDVVSSIGRVDAYGLPVAGAALTLSPTFGLDSPDVTVRDGSNSDPGIFTVTNFGSSPTTAVTVELTGADPSEFFISSDTCAGVVLAGGASCAIGVMFAPMLPGLRTATLAVSAATGGTTGASLSGTGISLTVTPANWDFGSVTHDTSSPPKTFTVTNASAGATTAITDVLTGADTSQFHITSDTCNGTTLAADASCTVEVTFAPTLAHIHAVSLAVDAATGGSTIASLLGTGGGLFIDPTTTDFGTVLDGASSALTTFSVTNWGSNATTTISDSFAGTDPSRFHITFDTCAGRTLYGGSSCMISVGFAPTLAGLRTAVLAVDAATGGSARASLWGAGNPLTINLASFYYGLVLDGTSSRPRTFTVTNVSGATVRPIVASLAGTAFTAASDTCTGASLAPRATCHISVVFRAPDQSFASVSAGLSVSGSPGISTTAELTAATTPVAIAPITESYGTVRVGSSASATFTITNVTSEGLQQLPLGPSSVTGDGFTVTSDGCYADYIAAGASCTVVVAFAPSASTTYHGQLTVGYVAGCGIGGCAVLPAAQATLIGKGG